MKLGVSTCQLHECRGNTHAWPPHSPHDIFLQDPLSLSLSVVSLSSLLSSGGIDRNTLGPSTSPLQLLLTFRPYQSLPHLALVTTRYYKPCYWCSQPHSSTASHQVAFILAQTSCRVFNSMQLGGESKQQRTQNTREDKRKRDVEMCVCKWVSESIGRSVWEE